MEDATMQNRGLDSMLNNMEAALQACGVTDGTLGTGEKEALDRLGYVVLPAVVDREGLERLRAAFERVVKEGPADATAQRTGTRHVEDLAGRDAAFEVACTHPTVIAAVHHVLRRPFGVLQLSGRDPLPGYGQQGLHSDWLPRAASDPFSVVTAIWILDDFGVDSGSTRVVPGSHLLPRLPPKSMSAPHARHPEQKVIVAPAGSVLLFNGHLWHSGTRNDARGPRRVLQCQFVARSLIRPADARPPGHLSPAARYFLYVQGSDRRSERNGSRRLHEYRAGAGSGGTAVRGSHQDPGGTPHEGIPIFAVCHPDPVAARPLLCGAPEFAGGRGAIDAVSELP